MKKVVREIPVGAELNLTEKKITINQDKINEDKLIPGDKRTFEILKLVANSIDTDIKVTIDVPSEHPELKNRMPF